MALFTATTYSTNTEVRAAYPQIDTILPQSMLSVAHDGSSVPFTAIAIQDTNGFPFTGEITLIDSGDTVRQLEYTHMSALEFFLETSCSFTFGIGTTVTAASYMLNRYRSMAKALVDGKLTNMAVPTGLRKTLEIMWVFYLATQQHSDAAVLAWGVAVKANFDNEVKDIRGAYPGALRQTIAKRVEENLSADTIYRLKYGPNGDQ